MLEKFFISWLTLSANLPILDSEIVPLLYILSLKVIDGLKYPYFELICSFFLFFFRTDCVMCLLYFDG